MSVLTVFITVVSLLLMAVPGFLLQKFKLLPHKAETSLSNLVLYGLQPFLLFMSFQNESIEYSGEIVKNMLIVLGLVTAVHLIMIGLMFAFIRGNKDEKKKRSVRYGSVFANCGFMGLPFLQMLFNGKAGGGEIMVYVAVTLVVWSAFNWTFGVYMMTGDTKDISVKKVVLNPVIIALVLGLVSFFACKGALIKVITEGTFIYDFVSKILSSFKFLSDAVTPLSMVIIGMKLAKMNVKKVFTDKWAYITCAIKLIGMSLVSVLIVSFLPIDSLVKYAVFFSMSMPCATSTVMFAVKFKGDADFASAAVALSTVLSIVSIPLMYFVMNGLFGVAL